MQNNAAASAPVHGAHVAGVTLIGATPGNLHKLLLTLGFIVGAWLITKLLRFVLGLFIGSRTGTRFQFWAKQGVSLIVAAILLVAVMLGLFGKPARLAGGVGVVWGGGAFWLSRRVPARGGPFFVPLG